MNNVAIVENLKMQYKNKNKTAVDGISFEVREGSAWLTRSKWCRKKHNHSYFIRSIVGQFRKRFDIGIV